ncbi:MAG: hypothetical protein HRU38_12485 [Saccharospirillaceae bacterium]|nr:hypothetical protein [Pseudomonadales bacterium]NRB79464.1 hypothetical protein [Saccharospirillaceae bacterium]
MKKLPAKFKAPLTGLMMMTYMITLLPLLLVFINAPEGAPIFEIYKASLKNALTNVVPFAIMLAVPGIITFNFIISRFLVQKENK